jgi:hypothetical protein
MPIPLALVCMLALQGKAPLSDPGQERQEEGVLTGTDRASALRILLTGHVDLHYAYRSEEVDLVASGLNTGTPSASGSAHFWAGRIGMRADVDVKDLVSGVIELENRSFESGANRPFGSSPTQSTLDIRQGYIEAGEFLTPHLNVRIGVQNVTLRNRPHDEAFFMDLGESESFFSGFQPGNPPGVGHGRIVNTADRDFGQPTGIRVFYSPVEIMTLEAFWMVYRENASATHDESIYAVTANSLLGEQWASWLLFAAVNGGDQGLSTVWTIGAGVDGYVGEAKELELFAEAYYQGGTLVRAPAAVHKEAYAFNVGARCNALIESKLWGELAVSRRSGDRRPDNNQDQAFQSYENVNRFLIMESNEFGLDIDTNVTCLRAAVGAGPFNVSGRPLRVQVDVGRFAAVAPVRSLGKQWGVESDLTLTWDYNQSFSLSLKGAWLGDSDLFKRFSGENHALLGVFSADLKF